MCLFVAALDSVSLPPFVNLGDVTIHDQFQTALPHEKRRGFEMESNEEPFYPKGVFGPSNFGILSTDSFETESPNSIRTSAREIFSLKQTDARGRKAASRYHVTALESKGNSRKMDPTNWLIF